MDRVERFDFDSVDSTNEAAKRLLAEGRILQRAVVVAREQTAGKGTRGRHWVSPRDAGLYLSVVETGWTLPRAPATEYTLAAGIACVEAIRGVTGIEVRLKPINDLFVGERKLGGILVETTIQHGALLSLVTGIGINLRHAERRLPPDAVAPVCLQGLMPGERFAAVDARSLITSLAEGVIRWNAVVAAGDADCVRRAWELHKGPGTSLPTGNGLSAEE